MSFSTWLAMSRAPSIAIDLGPRAQASILGVRRTICPLSDAERVRILEVFTFAVGRQTSALYRPTRRLIRRQTAPQVPFYAHGQGPVPPGGNIGTSQRLLWTKPCLSLTGTRDEEHHGSEPEAADGGVARLLRTGGEPGRGGGLDGPRRHDAHRVVPGDEVLVDRVRGPVHDPQQRYRERHRLAGRVRPAGGYQRSQVLEQHHGSQRRPLHVHQRELQRHGPAWRVAVVRVQHQGPRPAERVPGQRLALQRGTPVTVGIPDTSARYMRYLGHGNSVDLRNALTEAEVEVVAGASQRLYLGSDGKLGYRPYPNGDTIPDFSRAGY